jgi:toxin FitB
MIKYLLNTNTISELQKKVPDANVASWFLSEPISQLYLPSFTIAEIEMGIHQQRDLEKAEKFQTWLEAVVLVKFTNRILPFDTVAARVYGRWAGENRKNGTPLTVTDTQIAAIAYIHGLVVATRNTADFASLPIRLVNPWLEPQV